MTPTEMLDVEFEHYDFDEPLTFRAFFKELLQTLFLEGEGFSGKRPFGNSGWKYQIDEALEARGVFNPGPFVKLMIEAL